MKEIKINHRDIVIKAIEGLSRVVSCQRGKHELLPNVMEALLQFAGCATKAHFMQRRWMHREELFGRDFRCTWIRKKIPRGSWLYLGSSFSDKSTWSWLSEIMSSSVPAWEGNSCGIWRNRQGTVQSRFSPSLSFSLFLLALFLSTSDFLSLLLLWYVKRIPLFQFIAPSFSRLVGLVSC